MGQVLTTRASLRVLHRLGQENHIPVEERLTWSVIIKGLGLADGMKSRKIAAYAKRFYVLNHDWRRTMGAIEAYRKMFQEVLERHYDAEADEDDALELVLEVLEGEEALTSEVEEEMSYAQYSEDKLRLLLELLVRNAVSGERYMPSRRTSYGLMQDMEVPSVGPAGGVVKSPVFEGVAERVAEPVEGAGEASGIIGYAPVATVSLTGFLPEGVEAYVVDTSNIDGHLSIYPRQTLLKLLYSLVRMLWEGLEDSGFAWVPEGELYDMWTAAEGAFRGRRLVVDGRALLGRCHLESIATFPGESVVVVGSGNHIEIHCKRSWDASGENERGLG